MRTEALSVCEEIARPGQSCRAGSHLSTESAYIMFSSFKKKKHNNLYVFAVEVKHKERMERL